jgi:shikimate kinase
MPLVWLVGMMGSGKSAVGRLIALRHDCPFVDTDTVVESLAGLPIRQIFEQKGEPWFRDVEAAAVSSLTSHEGVVATGGGVILREDNVTGMRASGPVVWLRASVGTLLTRVGSGRNRPLLAGAPIDQRLEALQVERSGLYEAAATVVIDTDGRSIATVADAIEALL